MSLLPTRVAPQPGRIRRILTSFRLPAFIAAVATQGGGVYKPMTNVSTPYVNGVRLADVAGMKAVVRHLDSLLRRDAAISPPASDVLIQPFGSVSRPATGVEHELTASYSIYLLHPQQRCNASGCRVDNGEGPKFGVSINNPLSVMGIWGGTPRPLSEKGATAGMYRGVRQVGELSGFPVYENGAIVIARRGMQPWLPVTREEYVRAEVEELRAMGQNMASVATDGERELAALTDGGAPAYCCHTSRGHPIGVASESEPGTFPVVRLNPEYFDGSAGATGVRLLVVGSEQAYAAEMRVKPTAPNYQLMKAIREALDWNGLAAMVK